MKKIISDIFSSIKISRTLLISGAVTIGLALILLLILFENRRTFLTNEVKDRSALVKAGPEVRVASAKRSPEERLISLTGEAHPYAEVVL
jgi:hypothetical protein